MIFDGLTKIVTQTNIMLMILGYIILIIVKAASPEPDIVNNVDVTDMFAAVSYKLEVYTNTLNKLDSTVKSLEEKSHNWAIFRHHIDVWNMQMHVMEEKLNALQRGQDDEHGVGAKISKIEVSLNHIQNQIELIADNCHKHKDDSSVQNSVYERSLLNKDFKKGIVALKKMKNEAITRLNNILRYLQKEEARINCEGFVETESSIDEDNILITGNFSHKDIRKFQEQTKKNTKNLEHVVKSLGNVQKKLSHWHDNAENNVNYMTKQCQSATKELSTFTESSDLLLKRIEALVRDFGEKLNNVNWHFTPATVNNEVEEENISNQDNIESYEEDMSDPVHIPMDMYTDLPTSVEDYTEHTLDFNSNSNDIDYIQPDKNGCHELNKKIDGIYWFAVPILNAAGRDFNERLCVFRQDGPAWTVIQNRGPYEEQENFNRSWQEYSTGFGALSKDFWFGNEFIHKLSFDNDHELRIELEDFAGDAAWAEYQIFRLDNENFNYNLLIGNYSGNVSDAMAYHNEMDFSTFDRSNDRFVQGSCSCASSYGSGWWFNSCAQSNLNGIYRQSPTEFNFAGIIWEPWHEDYSLKKARIMMRPKHMEGNFQH